MFVVFAAFAVGVVLGLPRLPAAAAPDAPADVFSAGRAMDHVRAWASEPRPSGSVAHARVLAALESELRAIGLVVAREETNGLVNLVARAPTSAGRAAGDVAGGAAGDGVAGDGVWLVAHSDSVPQSPGAADDALGLAVVVEAARALSAGGVPAALNVLVTDDEERGLFGAKAHVAAAGGGARVVLNVEARGTEGPAYMFQTAGPSGVMLDAWQDSGCRAQATSFARAVYEVLPNDTDFTVFRRAGWWGYDFALIHGAWRYHHAEDTPANLDPRSVQQVGDCVVGLARAWLARPGDRPTAASAPDEGLVYAQIVGRTIVLPPWVVRLVAALALGGIVVAGRNPAGPRRPASAPGPSETGDAGARGGAFDVVLGALAWVGALVAAFAGGIALQALLVRMRPDFWERDAEMTEPHLYYALAIGLGGVVGWLAVRLAARWSAVPARGWHLAAGVAGTALALVLPTIGYLLVPGAQASAALLRGRPGLAVAPALLAGLLLGPVLHSLPPALTTRATPVLCVVPVLLLAWLLPVRRPVPRALATPAGAADP